MLSMLKLRCMQISIILESRMTQQRKSAYAFRIKKINFITLFLQFSEGFYLKE